MNLLETALSGIAGGLIIKGADFLLGLPKMKADRATSRESLADGATKTALEALEKSLRELRVDVEAQKAGRAEAEATVQALSVSVAALAERIEEQNRELALQPKLKAENGRLRRQVTELQKQVSDLKSRITELETVQSERVQLEATILLLGQGEAPPDPNTPPDASIPDPESFNS